MEALALANEIRLEQARVKLALASREISLYEVLYSPSDAVQRMKVEQLLRAIPIRKDKTRSSSVTPRRALRACAKYNINIARRIGQLTDRQKEGLWQDLGGR